MKKTVVTIMLATILIFTSLVPAYAKADENVNSAGSNVEIYETSVDYGSMLNVNDVPYFYDVTQNYIAENPQATKDDINNFLKSEMISFYSRPKPFYIIDYFAGLSQPEKNLYNEDVWSGIRALLCANTANNQTNARYSSAYTWMNNGDAFRHCLWSALMTRDIGITMASRWGTAHEDGAPGQSQLERTMDLTNNAAGRVYAYSGGFGNYNDTQMANAVQDKVRNGELFRVVNNKLVFTNGETGK